MLPSLQYPKLAPRLLSENSVKNILMTSLDSGVPIRLYWLASFLELLRWARGIFFLLKKIRSKKVYWIILSTPANAFPISQVKKNIRLLHTYIYPDHLHYWLFCYNFQLFDVQFVIFSFSWLIYPHDILLIFLMVILFLYLHCWNLSIDSLTPKLLLPLTLSYIIDNCT